MNQEIQSLGATLVAISPSTQENAAAIAAKANLEFDILIDPGNTYADTLGLRFSMPDELRQAYSGFGIDLPKFNGDDSWTLPVPARFVVGSDGVIRSTDADEDYTTRPEAEATVAVLRSLNG